MTDNQLPVPVPLVYPDTEHFWQATGREEFLLQRCNGCSEVVWYPRAICPECYSTDLDWFEASRRGHIYSWTLTNRGTGNYSAAGPYVLAYVQLDEGPRMLTNLVDYAPDDLAIGQSVELVFHSTGEGTALPRFRPVSSR